jgi:hypothetical protein
MDSRPSAFDAENDVRVTLQLSAGHSHVISRYLSRPFDTRRRCSTQIPCVAASDFGILGLDAPTFYLLER